MALQGPIPLVAAFILALALTPLVRFVARRFGAVAAPKADRWHSKPTAMMGGVAIFVAVIVALVLTGPLTTETWVVVGASTFMFALGLVDDVYHLKPYQKLIGQILGAMTVIYFGLVLPWTGSVVINMVVTFVWLVGITNAVNMLDNMDGLAAGVSAIAAVFLGVNFVLNHQPHEALMLFTFAAALAGFLVYNHNPASIFMGDCGSMFIGFFLSSCTLLSAQAGGGRSRSVIAVLAAPVLVLCIPIFDTTFVTIMRKLAGRAASRGGRDHTSHRLVALGLSEKHAVWMLYGFALMAGALAVLLRSARLDTSIAALAAFTIVFTLIGVHLARVRVYDEAEIAAAQEKPIVSFLVDLSYKRRIFEVVLDVALIMLAYYSAYALIFGPLNGSTDWQLFMRTLPAVVGIKLGTFLLTGVYRGIWRYVSVANVVDFARAVAISSTLTILAILFAFRFDGFSRTVYVIDAILLFAFVTISRFAFRLFAKIIPGPNAKAGNRVFIFGAGDGGELLARELQNNSALRYVVVGFLDDDIRKHGKVVHGFRVHPAQADIVGLCHKHGVREILVSTEKVPVLRLQQFIASCTAAGITVQRMSIQIKPFTDDELGWVLPTASDAADAAAVASARLTYPDSPLVTPTRRLPSDH